MATKVNFKSQTAVGAVIAVLAGLVLAIVSLAYVNAVGARVTALESRKLNCDESYFDVGKSGDSACAEVGKQCVKVNKEQRDVWFATKDFSCNTIQAQDMQIIGLDCSKPTNKNFANPAGSPQCSQTSGAEPYDGDTWTGEFFKAVCCSYS